ncbi:MAG: cytochrome b/b6 domain-containing protein [Rhodocyclaceae bacterium]|jgi:cytochrome b|nr:cytochrome b/b6 domain-containing protein [Rhodocyclaceae bacterium]
MAARALVWDLPVRVFHWTLAISFVIAFLSAESERYRDIHVLCGYLTLALIGFRLVWGMVGSRHARFASFVRGPSAVWRYLRSLLSTHPEHHLGHNPAGAVAILLLLALGSGSGLTGWATFNERGGEAVSELHVSFANAMLALVVVHLVGVAVSSLLHRENLLRAMVTGYKNAAPEDGSLRKHGGVAALLIVALVTLGWGLTP